MEKQRESSHYYYQRDFYKPQTAEKFISAILSIIIKFVYEINAVVTQWKLLRKHSVSTNNLNVIIDFYVR